MLILTEQVACFVCVPKTGSQAVSAWLESHFRQWGNAGHAVESLNDWHASLPEVEATKQLAFSVYDLWSFAIVRNPFDRLVSYCAAFDEDFANDPHGSLRRALETAIDGDVNRWMMPQAIITQGVKSVFRFESFADAEKRIRFRLGIEDASPIPAINESSHQRYPVYFTSELKEMAESFYAEDLRTFEYRF